MQAPLPGSVNLMPVGPSARTSPSKTGQDGIFAAHLATASQEQTITVQQESRGRQESGSTEFAGQSPDSENNTINADSPDELSLDATINGSAGAIGVAMPPVQPFTANAELTRNQSMVPTRGEDSFVSRMLDSLTSITGGVKAAGQSGTPTPLTEEPTNALLQREAAVQTFPGQEGQPPPNPLKTSPENTGTPTLPGPSFSEGSGIIQIDNTSVQSRATVSVVPDTARASEVTSATGQVAPATAPVTNLPPNPLMTSPESTGAPTLPAPSFSERSGIIQVDNTAVEPRIIVSLDPARASGTDQSQIAEALTTRQQETVQKGIDQLVQNKYGQIITIHQSGATEEMVPTMVAAGTTASIGTNQNLDITGNYIHAHLPNEASRTTEKDGNGQQQETAKDNQQKDANTVKITLEGQAQPEQAASQKFQIAVGQESQPLIFAHQQANASLIASTDSTSSTASSMLRLPSGLFIPSGTVVDQMIAHFSVNRQMESSSVNIKLHPQELGEVRMEIKVHQDNIKAHIIAQNPQAEEMINRHLPRLREALEQQGLHLQQIDVTVATHDNNSGKERFQEHAGQQQLHPSVQNRSSQPAFSLDTAEGTEEATNNLSVLA